MEVLVDCPGAEGAYTYAVPPELNVHPGDILSVPFGPRQVGAIALRRISEVPPHIAPRQVRPVEDILNRRFFNSTYWQLLERVAQHYQSPLIHVLRTALPPGLLAKSQRRVKLEPQGATADADLGKGAASILTTLRQSPTQDYTWQYLRRQGGNRQGLQQLLQRGWVTSYLAAPRSPKPQQRLAVSVVTPRSLDLTPRQGEILALLQRQGGELWLSDALQLCRTTSSTLKRLAAAGALVIEPREQLRTLQDSPQGSDSPKPLTPDQQRALQAISNQDHHRLILLHGVTGSGKTEVYLQAIAPLLATGRSALVLVPEIGLTPQLTDRFRRRFGQRVHVYHSALSSGERYDTWRQMLLGDAQVVIGTRSAVFAPLPRLGMIILDEEHDSSFKQDVPPCYHAKTVAQWRAELEDCPLVLGSATPSLETWVQCQPNVSLAPQHPLYLHLPNRIQSRPMPPVQVVDMRQEIQQGNRSIFSRSLQTALRQMKGEGNQGLLFIHRRGHSSFVSCRSCGHVMMCPHCDVSLSYHQPRTGAMSLRCHYCGYLRSHPRHCPECASPYLKHFGSGTQRVEQALQEVLPELSCIRFDSDTTRTKGAHRMLLSRFADGQADLLVGTQMLTKGIDLPQVTLVGIIAADGLLYMADYWASERCFQTLTQVAGRAGRGEQPGQVILQTYTPEHPVIAAVKAHGYKEFITSEWQQRQMLQYPPAGQLVLLRITSPDAARVKDIAQQLADSLESWPDGEFELLGPAPAPILRVARRYRWQLLLKFPQGATLPDLTGLRKLCPPEASLTIDVDPLNLG